MRAATQDVNRESAIEQYIALRMRAESVRLMYVLYYGIRHERIVISGRIDKRDITTELMDAAQRASYQFFAALLDLGGVNVFDSLLLLFPYDPGIIGAIRQKFEQLTPTFERLRIMKRLPSQGWVEAQSQMEQLIGYTRPQLHDAVKTFIDCMTIVISTEERAIPDLKERLEAMNLQHHPAFRDIFEECDR